MKLKAFKHKVYYPQLPAPASPGQPASSREEMILKYTPQIKYIAHRLAMRLPPHISIEDLIGAGVIGLLDALNKFDPEKKVQFKTYAEFRIKGAMLDELRSLDWVSRSVRQKATEVEKTYRALEKKKGGAVEDDEIARELGLSLDDYYSKLNEIRGIFLLDIDSLREKIPHLHEGNLMDRIMDDKGNHPLHLLSLVELKKVLVRAIEELPYKEKTVISLYYYDELTLKEIGEVLGYTESRICQLHTKAILKLRSKVRSYLQGER